MGVVPSASSSTARAQVQLSFVTPTGAPINHATVRVYLKPLHPPATYKPAVIAEGTSDATGLFAFDLSPQPITHLPEPQGSQGEPPASPAPDVECGELIAEYGYCSPPDDLDPVGSVKASSVLDAVVLAVDPSHRWHVFWHLILPLTDPYSETITAVEATGPYADPSQYSADELTEVELVSCSPDYLEENGPDPRVSEVEDDPDAPALGYAPHDPLACELTVESDLEADPALTSAAPYRADCPDGHKCRLVMVTFHHAAKGMESAFEFEPGSRDTKTESVCRHPTLEGWHKCGWVREHSERNTDGTVKKKDGFHRKWHAGYVYSRYFYCGPGYCRESWEPNYWDWRLKRSNVKQWQPEINHSDLVKIPLKPGHERHRYSGHNNVFPEGVGLSVSVSGGPVSISLASQAGYTNQTGLRWKGVGKSTCKRWLAGLGGDPSQTPRVFAYSTC